MSTRSFIGKLNQDNTVDYIYTHWDGYCACNGFLLLSYVNSEKEVNNLLSKGDMSSLVWLEDKSIEISLYNNPAKNVPLTDFLNTREHWNIEYFYLYDVAKQHWLVASVHAPEFKLYPLEHLLAYELKSQMLKGDKFASKVAASAIEKGFFTFYDYIKTKISKEETAEFIPTF